MHAPADQTEPATQRVRCRQIADGDLPGLADLVARGVPRSSHAAWVRGFERLAALAPVPGMPRFGYALEGEPGIVGVLLWISSQLPAGRLVANLSSWYVEPAWRAHSTLLV